MKPARVDPDPDHLDLVAFMESSLIETISYGLRNVLISLIRKGWEDRRILEVVRSQLGNASDTVYAVQLFLEQQRIITTRPIAE